MTVTVTNVKDIRAQVKNWHKEGLKVALVPTMGALHDGHLSLVRTAKEHADRIIVSIFVNPTQFAPHEDLDAYPREEAEDVEKLASEGVDIAFIPSVSEIYGNNALTEVKVTDMTEVLCGVFRPTHFAGVTTIVNKLFMITRADIAVFGEKDYQQLQVIKKMVSDLNIPIEVIGSPIVREQGGLAMSSRNKYLTDEQRKVAAQLNKTLLLIIDKIKQGENIESLCQGGEHTLLDIGFDSVDYLEVRDAVNLDLATEYSKGDDLRIFVAAKIGQTRLIDNMAV